METGRSLADDAASLVLFATMMSATVPILTLPPRLLIVVLVANEQTSSSSRFEHVVDALNEESGAFLIGARTDLLGYFYALFTRDKLTIRWVRWIRSKVGFEANEDYGNGGTAN